jgi:hypothetical protein
MHRYPLLIVGLLAALLLGGAPSLAQESTYSPWQGQTQAGDLPQLLKQLRSLIDKADKANAADPVFLDDLRKLADSYDTQWPVKLLFDDFRDGNITASPVWTVTAGNWRVNLQSRMPGLQTRVVVPQAASQGSTSTQSAVIGALGALLGQQQGGQAQQPPQDQYAAISTTLAITNAFAIRLEIASGQPGGRFDIGPYLGARADTGYFLSYVPATANGLVLSSVTAYAGTKQLASSSGQIQLEDNASHVIDWKRDRTGKMTVALDGKTVIDATDLTIRKPFQGFLMANSGGLYAIRSVTINGSR